MSALVQFCEAVEAADAFPDFFASSSGGFMNKVRICKMSSANTDKVTNAFFQKRFSGLRIFYVIDRDYWNFDIFSDFRITRNYK